VTTLGRFRLATPAAIVEDLEAALAEFAEIATSLAQVDGLDVTDG
jgi:hypothetical protein